MQAQTRIEPTARRRGMLAKLMGVIRGDKYMIGAYPPEAPGAASPAAPQAKEE